jgi:hypothetical protein
VTARAPRLETGNVADAGAVTRGWFVGDLSAWATSRGDELDPQSTLRQHPDLEVRWFVHPPGDARPEWAQQDSKVSLGILVDGDMRLDFRASDGAADSVRLARRGDYVLWHGPTWAHSWRTEGGCTFLTVRWPTDSDHDADPAR